MPKPKYVYLVSDGKKITVTMARPKKLKIKNGKWSERFTRDIGEAITVHTDNPWIGTVGVYDTSKRWQIVQLAEDMSEHALSLAARKIQSKLDELFGQAAAENVMGYRCAPSSNAQRNYKWTPQGQLLHNAEEIVNGVCFRGE